MTIPGREENIDKLEGFISPGADMINYVENYAKRKLKGERLSMSFWVLISLFFISFYITLSPAFSGKERDYVFVVVSFFSFTIIASVYRFVMTKDAEEKFEKGAFLYKEVYVKRVSSFEGFEERKKVLKIVEEKDDGGEIVYNFPFKVKKWNKGEKMCVIKYKKGKMKGGMNDYFMIRTLEEERKEVEERAKEKEN